MKKYKLSVIIPCYNSEKFIVRTLNCFDVSNLNIQIIAIDDGSSDKTLEILNNYKKKNKNVKIDIYSQNNNGVSVARNRGIEMVKGEYLLFFDSDDYFFKDKLTELLDILDKYQLDCIHFGYDFATYKNEVITKYSEKYKYISLIKTGIEVLEEVLKMNVNFWTGNYITKSEVIKENNITYDPRYKYGEDQLFAFEVLNNSKKVSSYKETCSLYVQHKDSVMQKFNEFRYDSLKGFREFSKKLDKDMKNLIGIKIIEDIFNISNSSISIFSFKEFLKVREKCLKYFKFKYLLNLGFKMLCKIILYFIFPRLYYFIIDKKLKNKTF